MSNMLTTHSYPSIVIYRYHFFAIFYASSAESLTAAGESIQKTVPANHPELPMLIAAGTERRKEMASQPQEQEIKS